jgi:hypothetical protein
MHVHINQFDLNAQIYNLSATARAEARLAAERTRNKLLNAASVLAGEDDQAVDCVVSLSEDNASEDRENPRNRQHPKKHDLPANSENFDNPFSDWA